ncbi:type II secretion system minor pseudopilin GspI [Parahaliea mediterranea]|uniref:Type II secretion system protein I n=2 Tax=Parahaliea mediterranea TaxID=651086 RepID=A0A939DD95_9GAMM|nr:type II secretion system minor pseudopilin GspI [Parahaliea mediterranea]
MTPEAGNRGFTLVEVMVALAVVALALPALVMSLYQQVDGTEHLRDKSLAQVVAANKLAEIRLVSQARQNLLSGSESGNAELAGRQWSWQISTRGTTMQSFQRVEIAVRPGEDRRQGPALYTLVAYLSAEIEAPGGEGAGEGS